MCAGGAVVCPEQLVCMCLSGVCLPLAVLGHDGFTGGDCRVVCVCEQGVFIRELT